MDHYDIQHQIQDREREHFNMAPHLRGHEYEPSREHSNTFNRRDRFDRRSGSGNQFRDNIFYKNEVSVNFSSGNNARGSLRGRFEADNARDSLGERFEADNARGSLGARFAADNARGCLGGRFTADNARGCLGERFAAVNFVKGQSIVDGQNTLPSSNEENYIEKKPSTIKFYTQCVDGVKQFSSVMKGECTQAVDAKFEKLCEAVKFRNLSKRNDIEILHMAVDKVRMVLNDQVQPYGKTATGQPLCLCRLEIDGVFIAQGLATSKKAAKHDAYSKAVKILLSRAVAVQEVSSGVFELKSNVAVTPTIQQSAVAAGKRQLSALVMKGAVRQQATATASCTIPRMIFDQAVHLPTDKPSSFMKSETQIMIIHNRDTQQQESAMSSAQCAAMKDPTTMAMTLLNVVRDGGTQDSFEISQQNEQMSVLAIKQERNCDMLSCPSAETNVNLNAAECPIQPPMCKKRRLDTTSIYAGQMKARRTASSSHITLVDLSQFIIIDKTSISNSISDMAILHFSANFNKVLLKVEYEMTNTGMRCSMDLSDHTIAYVLGETKEIAKRNAAREALKYLRYICYTIKIKQHYDSDIGALTKEQLLDDIENGGEVIPDSNIGNMLLRKMGWTGGGVEKVSQGIAEPVKAEMVIIKEGLGSKDHKGFGNEFNEKVTKLLQGYLQSDEQKDLYFSSKLSKQERAEIHTIGQGMGLKTVSKGTNDNRYLIVSKKRSAQELLEYVVGSGGSTSKYELISPGMQCDMRIQEDSCGGQLKQEGFDEV